MVLSVEDINWEELKQGILREKSFVNKCGDECKEKCLGRVSDLTPSGKHRDFGRPARNVNGSPGSYKGYVKGSIDPEFQTDSDWWRKLLTEAEKHEIYVRPSDDEHRMFLKAGMKTGDRSEPVFTRKSKKRTVKGGLNVEDAERAYLAGLFDGEGCANATFRSKAYKEKRYWWPAVQFIIAGQYQHMCQISKMFGAGGNVYEQSNRNVWEFRATKPEQVLRLIDIILPYVKLKNRQLQLLRSAAEFMMKHRSHSKWSHKDRESFNKNFVQPLQKSTRTGEKKGRKRTHAFL